MRPYERRRRWRLVYRIASLLFAALVAGLLWTMAVTRWWEEEPWADVFLVLLVAVALTGWIVEGIREIAGEDLEEKR